MLPGLEKGIETSIIVNDIGISAGASWIVSDPSEIIVEVRSASFLCWNLLAELWVV